MNNFIGRKNELDFLEQKYKSENGQLVIIYGRRRIGKTETIKQFCNDKRAVFFTCTQTEDKNQLKNFSSILLSNNLPQAKYISEFNSWEQAFLALKDFPKLEEEKQIIVIDEFPYMVKGNSEIPSVLQKLWDTELNNQNIMIILCGSAMSFIEKEILSDAQLEKLHTAQKYTDELGNLIEHFFEYSYLITARIEPSLEKINLTNLTIDCVLSYIGIFEEKNISVNIEETPPIYVLGDKNMLTRVIENLLNNCAKHSLGDIDVKIESKSKARITFINPVNPNININVDKLFHRFYTGDSTRNKSTGLGLSIVEFLVEQMNGNVGAYLDTKSNKIAIFFEVPLFI